MRHVVIQDIMDESVYEIMPISRKIKNLIASGANADEITAQAVTEGMNTLRMSASNYVKQGLTSFSEMMKITYETDDTN